MKFVQSLSRNLHAWGGFFLSSLIILISLSGAALVWKREYLLLTEPEAREQGPLNPEMGARIASSAESLFGGENIYLIQYQSENTSLHKVFLTNDRYAYLNNIGELVDLWHLNERPEEWLYDFHHRLLLGDTGLLICGLAGLTLLILILPAVFSWWPTRRAFSWQILVRGMLRPQLLATHRNLGVLVVLPLTITLSTAVLLAFPDEAQEVLVDPHRTTQSYSDLYIERVDALTGREFGGLQSSLERAQSLMDSARIRSLQLPYGFSGYNLVGLQQRGDWHPGGLSLVYIEPESGRMDMSLDAFALPFSEKIYNLSYPLHTGKVDSLAYRVFLTLVGLSMAVLAMLGLLSFVKKQLNRIKLST